jgi:hypothetical protein
MHVFSRRLLGGLNDHLSCNYRSVLQPFVWGEKLCSWLSDLIRLPHSLALGSTQPLTETSTRNFLGGKGGRFLRLTNLTSLRANCVEMLRALTVCNPRGLPRPVQE